ncbi:MAG: hypothetical protein BWY77_00223 [bacterium ADurb.Bin431]|nr:MAG: hypothetical protein BWY77_00223 [bacterium ADurb.Bin431]
MIAVIEIGTMEFFHLCNGIPAFRIAGNTAGLSTEGGKACFAADILDLLCPRPLDVGAHIIRSRQKTVVVKTGPAQIAAVKDAAGSDHRIPEDLPFEMGGAYHDHAVSGQGGKQLEEDIPPVLGCLEAVGGAVPFAPGADESGLDQIDDILVLCQQWLKLIDVAEDLLPRGIRLADIVAVRDPQIYLDASGAGGIETALDLGEIALSEILVAVSVGGDAPEDQADSFLLQIGQRAQIGQIGIAVKAPLRVGKDLRGLSKIDSPQRRLLRRNSDGQDKQQGKNIPFHVLPFKFKDGASRAPLQSDGARDALRYVVPLSPHLNHPHSGFF